MKYIILICMTLFTFSCANNAEIKQQSSTANSNTSGKPVNTELKKYTYDIVRTFNHDPLAYTQGLFFYEGNLYESTGQRGESSLRKIDPQTGKVLKKVALADEYFGEGITRINDEIFMLTWTSGKCFVYDINTFKQKREYKYPGEGWGLTSTEDNHLMMTDGSNYIRYIDPNTFEVKNTIAIYYQNSPVNALNEIEKVDNIILANIYTSDAIAVIDLNTNQMQGIIDCSELRKTLKDNPRAEVLNGIAYDKETKHLYVTGKYWNTMFEIKVNDLF